MDSALRGLLYHNSKVSVWTILVLRRLLHCNQTVAAQSRCECMQANHFSCDFQSSGFRAMVFKPCAAKATASADTCIQAAVFKLYSTCSGLWSKKQQSCKNTHDPPVQTPAPPNYPLRNPKYHLTETMRPLIEVHWGI